MASGTNMDRDRKMRSKIPGEETGIEVRHTICSICNPLSHCGIDAYVKDGVVIKVEGTRENVHSGGTLCSKGAASRQYIYHQDRLRQPLLRKGERGAGEFAPISWDSALDLIAERLLKIKAETGPESVVFYAGYPKWMRPFLKRFALGFGSPNYATESSTCATATTVAHKLNYGWQAWPDVANTQCLLVWSTNPFYSNTSGVRRLVAARERGLKIIDVGPLITPLSSQADIHLRIRPGTSGALALGLAHVIIEEGLYDREFVDKWTIGFDAYRRYAQEYTPQSTEDITGVPKELIVNAARLYATSKPAAMMNSASPTVHHTNGVQSTRALTALIGLTGNYDQPGGNRVTLPQWLEVPNLIPTRARPFDQVRSWEDLPPRIGLKEHPVWCDLVPQAQAMQLPHQIQSKTPYPIRSVLGFGLNHRMWPGSDYMADSLKLLDFLVTVDLFMTDTGRLSDLILPACSSFERSELKFYVENFVVWTEPVIAPLGESRPDSDILFELAKRLNPDDALMAQGYEACLDWILEPSGLTIDQLRKHPTGYAYPNPVAPPFRQYEQNGFPTPSGKMEFTSLRLQEAGLEALPVFREPLLSPVSAPEVARDFPLILTTGSRLPMFIHSRAFRMKWTKKLRPDPMVDMNPRDAALRGIAAGDLVELSTPRNTIRVKANPTEMLAPGVVSMYHAYPDADVNLLIAPDYQDPISGFPGFKSLLCQIKKANS